MSSKYVYINEKGLTEEIDLFSGEITKKELSAEDLLAYYPERHNGKMRWIPIQDSSSRYSPAKGELFALALLEGKPTEKACAEVDITYGQYCRWRRDHEHFRDIVDEARKDRAERYFDKLENIVESVPAEEEEIAKARLQVDTYKHMAGVSDARRFSPTQKFSGEIGIARIVVSTGIVREGDVGYANTPAFKELDEAQERLLQEERLVVEVSVVKPEGILATEDELDGKVEKKK